MVRLAAVVIGLAIVFGGCSRGQGPEFLALPATDLTLGPCSVTEVVDGDTVRMACGKWVAPCEAWPKVRLLNIDTPERGEAQYSEALSALEEFVVGREVFLTFADPSAPTCGRYDRLLAYLFVDDRNINVEMVRDGWSPYWTKYGKGRYENEFEAAEAEALRTRARSAR